MDLDHGLDGLLEGRGAAVLRLSGPVDSDAFKAILEGRVPDGPHLGKRGKEGGNQRRPGRDATLSAPKSVSLMAAASASSSVTYCPMVREPVTKVCCGVPPAARLSQRGSIP